MTVTEHTVRDKLFDGVGVIAMSAAPLGFGIALASFALCAPMDILPFTLLVFAVGVAMGIGKASVYTYIPQYFPKDVGAVGGLVGAIGGLGGFVLPLRLK